MFRDRQDAGRQLANRLAAYADAGDVVVLGIPRGGVSVAFEIAKALRAPMDIFLSRKLGVPGHEELAFGAITESDSRFLDHELIRAAEISSEQVERVIEKTQTTLHQRAQLYRRLLSPLQTSGHVVILVDDGIATGASILAAISAVRQMNPKKLIVAVPVAAGSTCGWLHSKVDELVVLSTPHNFYAVGQFYEDFPQLSDEEVIDILRQADAMREGKATTGVIDPQEVSIMHDGLRMEGTLTLPPNPKGIVIFAHGSGSSRHSPRNRAVAETLNNHGLATLLFDLLTSHEESIDQRTAELRFNIALLSERLIEVTLWVEKNSRLKGLAIGYFGSSTGAAAAVVAAARLPDLVSAIVSRGGRPDLAAKDLEQLRAPTLLLVGSLDEMVIGLNRGALAQMKTTTNRLVIVPGASHLFEEPDTLEQVAKLTAGWMVHYLSPQVAKESTKRTTSA